MTQKELIDKAVKWTMSDEGQTALKKAMAQAKESSDAFTKACYIHPNDPRLFEPMTI